MNKAELIEAIASNAWLSIRGFGSWAVYVEAKTSRKDRNPQTGKEIKISAKKVVKFKGGSSLSTKVN
jgi:DNA-binding protein HU-beta